MKLLVLKDDKQIGLIDASKFIGPPGKDAILPPIEDLRGPPGENFKFPVGKDDFVWTWHQGEASWRPIILGGVGYRTRLNKIEARLTAVESGVVVVTSTFYPILDFSDARDTQLLMVI